MIGELGSDNREMGLGCFDEDIEMEKNEQRKGRNRQEKVSFEETKVDRKVVDEAIGGGKRGTREREEGLVMGL